MSSNGLKNELYAMYCADQEPFETLVEGEELDWDAINAMREKHTERLKEIIATQGFPTISLVGSKGASHAWMIAQHSDLDADFQEAFLKQMEELLDDKEVKPENYAYLYDRVAVNTAMKEKREPVQRYGTQFGGAIAEDLKMHTVEDPQNLNALRQKMNLGPIEDYEIIMRQKYT